MKESGSSSAVKKTMNKLGLSLALVALMFSLGCGSSNSGPTPSGNYSLASLNGAYVYQMSGFDLVTGNPYTRMGVFNANGAGTLTGGTDIFTEGAGVTTLGISGTYNLSNDGTGTLTFTFSNSTSFQWVFTLQSSSKLYLVEASSTGTFTGYGTGLLQTSTTAPSGPYVFKAHVSTIGASVTPTALVGQVDTTGGAFNGSADINTLGVGLIAATPATGSIVSPDSTGLGTGSVTINSVTNTFSYYVVDSSHIQLLFTTALAEGLGTAEAQTGTFSNATLSGSYAFGSRGDTVNNLLGVHTVGVFTADGAGNITPFTFDAQSDGVLTSNGSFSGNTYTVASNGRTAVTLNSGAAQQIYWLVNGARAFFINTDPNSTIDGTADLQSGSSFSNGSTNGQFAFVNSGVTLSGNPPLIQNTLDRVATLQFSGSGGLTLNEFINLTGSTSTPGFLSGSYSVSSNGRATGKINGGSNNINFVFYLISGNQAYVLQTDSGYEVDGFTQLQQ